VGNSGNNSFPLFRYDIRQGVHGKIHEFSACLDCARRLPERVVKVGGGIFRSVLQTTNFSNRRQTFGMIIQERYQTTLLSIPEGIVWP